MVNGFRGTAPAGTSFGGPSKGVRLYLAPVHTHFAKPATCTWSLDWDGWGREALFCFVAMFINEFFSCLAIWNI